MNVILDWYLNYEDELLGIGLEEVSKLISEFMKMVGHGETNKKLKNFKSPGQFEEFMEKKIEEIELFKRNDLKQQILSKPDAVSGDFKVYKIDYKWEEGGEALFADQTKWCVNKEHSYNTYKPLYLFTKGGHYFALFSPQERMFNDFQNDELSEDQYYEIEPLVQKMRLEDAAFDSLDRLGGPPDDELFEYAQNAWDSHIKEDFIRKLEREYEEEIEELSNELNEDIDLKEVDDEELFELLNETAEESGIYWEWEEGQEMGRRLWSVWIDADEIAKRVDWEDVAKLFYDDVERAIFENNPVPSEKLNKYRDIKRLRKKYPKYFRELAEKHGQTKLKFSSSNQAIQYLSDILNKTIIIPK
jgi:hypothetical protein